MVHCLLCLLLACSLCSLALCLPAFTLLTPGGDLGLEGLPGPHGRSGHNFVSVSDAITGRVRFVSFGGRSAFRNGDFLNDLWVYDLSTGNWTAFGPNEAVCDQCSVCEGTLAQNLPWNDSFCFDWTGLRGYMNPAMGVGVDRNTWNAPSGRYEHAAVFVQASPVVGGTLMVLFGGYSIDCTDYCGDTWHFLPQKNTWAQISRPAGQLWPAPRWRHAMAAYQDAAFLFGGHGRALAQSLNVSLPFYDDLWMYNTSLLSWKRLQSACSTCQATANPGATSRGPAGRYGASLLTVGNTLLLFGGYTYGGESQFKAVYPTPPASAVNSLTNKYYLNDMWRYSIATSTWTQLTLRSDYPAVPSPRHSHAAVLSQSGPHTVMLIHGGYTWDDEIGDSWQYNVSSNVWWRMVGEAPWPSRRFNAAMAAIPDGGALLLGGHGCEKGETYAEASAARALSGGRKTAYGELYCVEALSDIWKYSPAACPGDCSGHGICQYNVCICNSAWFGADCSGQRCPVGAGGVCFFDAVGRQEVCRMCSGRGTCDGATGRCKCTAPASGTDCALTDCKNDCNGNGLCDKARTGADGFGVCQCYVKEDGSPAYIGSDCSIPLCINGCSQRGACVNGTCACFPGFSYSCSGGLPSACPPENRTYDCSGVMFRLSVAATLNIHRALTFVLLWVCGLLVWPASLSW